MTETDNGTKSIVAADEITSIGSNRERRKKAIMEQVTAEAQRRVEERKRQAVVIKAEV